MDENILAALPARLVPWFAAAKRDLPWRRDREPYHVWVSEIMLQQTRVEAVVGYYDRFLKALPDIRALADAPEDQLMKLWEGLGYYSRARNLQKAARQIMERHGGTFPRDTADIRALAGIGDYTAGAIGSICFEYPTAAVDGNVLRVVSRVTGSDAPIDKPETKKKIGIDLSAVYPAGHCGDFTQSLMELGATVSAPRGATSARLRTSARQSARIAWTRCRSRAKNARAKLRNAPSFSSNTRTRSPSAAARRAGCSPRCGSCRTLPVSWRCRARLPPLRISACSRSRSSVRLTACTFSRTSSGR